MQTPLQITFRHMESSPAVEARVREEVDGLERLFDRITSCHVVIESPHKHRGSPFHIGIDIGVPRTRIVVNHEPTLHAALTAAEALHLTKHQERQPDHKDIYVCIRDAFNSARRQLEDYARVLRGDTKHHADEST